MTSKRTKDERVKENAIKHAKAMTNIDTCDKNIDLPPGAVPADHAQLNHNNTYSLLPIFYINTVFICRDCGKEELWTAENQKWWYEEAKGHIDSEAVRCRTCRDKRKALKDEKNTLGRVREIKMKHNKANALGQPKVPLLHRSAFGCR